MPPFLAFSSNCSWAICEFRSALGAGLSAWRPKPLAGCAQARLHHSAAAKTAAMNRTERFLNFLFDFTNGRSLRFQLLGRANFLRLGDHGIKRGFGLIVAVEHERLAVRAPGNRVIHAPERDQLQ